MGSCVNLPCILHTITVKNQLAKPAPDTITDQSSDVKTLCAQLDLLTVAADETLCRIFHQNGTSKTIFQKFVPHALRNQIADEMHKGLKGGHIGIRRA